MAASAKRPRMRSISRVPRCQQRNNSRFRRSSRPLLDRVEPVIFHFQSNAKSPDVPGGVDIASGSVNVSRGLWEKAGIYWLRRLRHDKIASVDVIGANYSLSVVPADAGTHTPCRLC